MRNNLAASREWRNAWPAFCNVSALTQGRLVEVCQGRGGRFDWRPLLFAPPTFENADSLCYHFPETHHLFALENNSFSRAFHAGGEPQIDRHSICFQKGANALEKS